MNLQMSFEMRRSEKGLRTSGALMISLIVVHFYVNIEIAGSLREKIRNVRNENKTLIYYLEGL